MLSILSGTTISKKVKNLEEGEKITESNINTLSVSDLFKIAPNDNSKQESINKTKDQYNSAKNDIQERFEDKVLKIRQGDDLLQVL